MKSLIISFSALFFTINTASAQTASNCTPSSLLSHTYGSDVKDLAVARMYAIHSADTSQINIPQVYQDTIMAGLAAICNTGTTLQADSIFDSYCIHEFPYGLTDTSLIVYVDTSYAWTHYWEGLQTTTGNGRLDSLMSLYDFKVRSFTYLSGLGYYAVIGTPMAINTAVFADSLALIAGIYQVDKNSTFPQSNSITYQKDSVQTYTFAMGWGDCPSGCTSMKTWQYKVDDNCNVTLLSVTEEGPDPYPAPLNCNLHPLSTAGIVNTPRIDIFPNPVNNLLHVSFDDIAGYDNYSITDMYGRVVSSGVLANNTVTGIGNMPAGVYIFNLSNGAGIQYHRKFVKE